MYDLNLFHAQIVSRYGGSIRCIVSKKKIDKTENFKRLLKIEKEALIENVTETYDKFINNIISSRTELLKILSKIKSENKTIIGKSCPARAVVLLNYCEINNQSLDYVAEQPTSLKLDYYIPGTKLKIINDDYLLKNQPDYILLLAWHLSEPIINKWKKKGLKSKFIVPLPKIKIYE